MGKSISIFYICVCVYVDCVYMWIVCICGLCARDACNRKLKLKMRYMKDEGYKINTVTICNV